MGTKTKTKTTIDYNKPSMGVYEGLQPQIAAYYKQILGPIADSPWFKAALQFNQRQATALGGRGMQNVLLNLAASGMGGRGMPGFQASALGRAGRATSRLQSEGFWNAYLGAAQQQQQGAAGAQAFRPLQMGQTEVQKTSGLGTWLPQTLGMVAGAALAPFTGGASLLGSLGSMGSSVMGGFLKNQGVIPQSFPTVGWAGSGGGGSLVPPR